MNNIDYFNEIIKRVIGLNIEGNPTTYADIIKMGLKYDKNIFETMIETNSFLIIHSEEIYRDIKIINKLKTIIKH